MLERTSNFTDAQLGKSRNLEERLNQHPQLRARIESLLSVVENAQGDVTKADEAEQRVVKEIRHLGQEALQEWANRQNKAQTTALIEKQPSVHRARQKNSTGTPGLAS